MKKNFEYILIPYVPTMCTVSVIYLSFLNCYFKQIRKKRKQINQNKKNNERKKYEGKIYFES